MKLTQTDPTNDKIWNHLHSTSTDALNTLNPDKYALDLIQQEIALGCSPCPDILSQDFGNKPSVMFVSTVYGLIHKYLKKSYVRQGDNWQSFIQDFYDKVILKGVGIYSKQLKIYEQLTKKLGSAPEFCYTELVKTVLIDPKGKVSGLEQASFINYFLEHEAQFLLERIQNIQSRCVIFTCSEPTTFFTLSTLAGEKEPSRLTSLPNKIEPVYLEGTGPKDLLFKARQKRGGNFEFRCATQAGSFSKSLAFKSIFKLVDKDVYIVPLPHPSGANNTFWKKDVVDHQLEILTQQLFI